MEPAEVQRRLWDIEEEMATKQPWYEEAADVLARVKREWDVRMAKALVVAEGSSKEQRESTALLAIVASDDDLYERLTDAEAKHNALRAVMASLQARASIGQSILRSLTQEMNRSTGALAWRQTA